MRKYIVLLLSGMLLIACSKKQQINDKVSNIPVDINLIRFDKEFVETPIEGLPMLKAKYPYLFPENLSNEVWIAKKKDTLFLELYNEVQKKYPDTKELENSLKTLFQHIKYYFPNQYPSKVVTVISEVDIDAKAIYTDSLALISLDTYLGSDHRFYQGFDTYLLEEFNSERIPSDLVESFLMRQIPFPQDRMLLSQMIFYGKLMYAKDLLLPDTPDALKIGYTPDQVKWCEANESQMWKYFVEKKILFDTDSKLVSRFIKTAPFSKFYLDLDTESPGRVGVWLGWQIVRAYMKNNNVTLQELLKKDAKDIFDNSKYKPKK